MKSMTGFGRTMNRASSQKTNPKTKVSRKSGSVPGASSARANSTSSAVDSSPDLEVAVRAVNGRFLEIRFHLPREYSGFESELKALCAQIFSRGTLDVYVNRARSTQAASVNVNIDLAMKWLEGYRQLGESLNLSDDAAREPSLEMLSKLPDVIKIEERSEASDLEKKLLKELLSEACAACDSERQREGKALCQELLGLCQNLEKLTNEMMELRTEANTELEKRLRDRLQKLGFNGIVDDQRIAQEVVMQLDRADISEELSRLREHVKAYRQLLKSTEPQGKKLDFYAQELLREVNTIGSKSQVAKLTSAVVNAKTIVEKIREQVQNVE